MRAQPVWSNRNRQSQPSSQPQQQSKPVNERFTRDTEVKKHAKKIKSEQGDKTAGYFLYAMRPYAAPGEISHIESLLMLRAERDPAQDRSAAKQSNMNMLGLLMKLMQSGQKPDPAILMRMMSG